MKDVSKAAYILGVEIQKSASRDCYLFHKNFTLGKFLNASIHKIANP